MKVDLKGFKELEKALAEDLPKATARNVLRKSMIEAMGTIENAAKGNVPVNRGKLRDSITTKAARGKRAAGSVKFARSTGIEVLTGPTGKEAGGNAAWQEFGTVNMSPNPFMRPAADANGQRVVDEVIEVLTANISKAKARIARKAARKAAKG